MAICMNCKKEISSHSFSESEKCASALMEESEILRKESQLMLDKGKRRNECVAEIIQHMKSF